MSFAAINWAWEQLDLPPGPKVVLMGLAHVADDGGMAWPSVGTLAVRANVSAMTVRRYIQHLVDAGLVSIERRQRPDGSYASNVYRLHVETPALPLSRGRGKAASDGQPAGQSGGQSQSERVPSQNDTVPSQDERGGTLKLSGGTLTGDTCNELPNTLKEKNSGAGVQAEAREGAREPDPEPAGVLERVFVGDVEVTSLPGQRVELAEAAPADHDDDPTDRGVWRPAQGRVPLDPGFRLPPEWRDFVCDRYDLAPEQADSLAESFKVHWLEKGAAKVDWRAQFVEWVKMSIAMAAERQGKDGLAEVAARRGRAKRAGGKAPAQTITFSKPAEAHDARFEDMRRGIVSQIGAATYASWIDKTAMRLDAGTLVITCRSAFHADEVRKRLHYPLQRYAERGFGAGIEIRIEGPERVAA